MGDYSGRMCRYKSGDCGFGALDGARRSRGLSEVHLEVRHKKRQQYFPVLRDKREKGPFRGKQKALVGAPRREGGLARKLKSEWQDTKTQGTVATAPPCPDRAMKTPLPQHSSSSAEDFERKPMDC